MATCWLFKNKLDSRHTVFGTIVIIFIAYCSHPFFVKEYIRLNKSLLSVKNIGDYFLVKGSGKFKSIVDNILLGTALKKDTLQLNKPYFIAQNLLNSAASPFISLQGHVPNNVSIKDKELIVEVNGVEIGSHKLNPGLFAWNIPLDSIKNTTPISLTNFTNDRQLSVVIQFKLNDSNKVRPSNLKLEIPVIIKGFLPAAEVLDLKKVQPHCQQQKASIVCQLEVTSNIRLLELPILYYPELLKITVNGQTVPYVNVQFQNHLITAITPIAGQVNLIKIQFRGLWWANFTSCVLWGLWLLIYSFLWFKRRHRKRLHIHWSEADSSISKTNDMF
jgi:hypothetical protein